MAERVNVNLGNIFGATVDRPYHLSVGSIVLDDNGLVYSLHYPKIDSLTDIYIFPNKTVRPNETLEQTNSRGALHALGCDVKLIAFLGTLVVKDNWWGNLGTPTDMEKSVVYFLSRATKYTPELAAEECAKEKCIVELKSLEFLIDSMSKWRVKDGMRDFDQIEMLRRARNWISVHPDLKSDLA
jgi:hypothetical protein